MANPAPTINQINAFNATQGTTIDFNIIGGTELIRSNRIYIYDLSDNSLICTHLYVSTESTHELPPNTDGSIVYESGKSSADFVNGAQYYAQIQTYTDTAGTQGGSGLSVAKMFWCLGDPTLTITTIPSTISTTSYNISATYTDTSASVVSNIIQQYQFNLYSATGSLLQSSGVVVGSGTQQGTSAVYDISHNFTGLNVGSSYYVTVDVTTTQGMSVNAQSNTFTVSIDTPTLGEATVVNNACDGYISVTSNLSGEYGGSGSGEIVSFETDSENVFSKLQVELEPIQEGSGDPSPSNVRPIRGHGGVTIENTGVNIWDEEWEVGSYGSDGLPIVSTDKIRTKNRINVKPSTAYYFKNGGSGNLIIFWYDDNDTVISYEGTDDAVKTSPANAKYLRFRTNNYGTTYNNDISINYPSTDHDYHEYNAQTITQDFNATFTPTSTDTTPYLFKAVGDVYGDRLEDKIVGGTVAWNQMCNATNSVSNDYFINNNDGTITVKSGATEYFRVDGGVLTRFVAGHKYLALLGGFTSTANLYLRVDNESGSVWISTDRGSLFTTSVALEKPILIRAYQYSGEDVTVTPQIFDLTQMFGSTIADYIYSLEQSQAGAGVAWFKKLFPNDYYAYNAGELLSVEGLQSHDTVGFNQWDEEWENINVNMGNGNTAPSTHTIGSKNFCPILPSTAYYATCGKTDGGSQNRYYLGVIFYDENKQYISSGYYNNLVFTTPEKARFFKITTNTSTVVYGNTYNHDICINLSNPTRNGEYEPYEKHSYPLDSSLTLRGIPKLDASNNLYYDGDEYKADGSVKRKYGVVKITDIPSSKFDYHTYTGNIDGFVVRLTGVKPAQSANIAGNALLLGFDNVSDTKFNSDGNDKEICINTLGLLKIKYNGKTTAEALKAALGDAYLIYELATPTTATATPYTNPQIVSKYGTIEYVTNSIVPVGHKTTYLTRDIFGGYVDLISGELVVDRVGVDLGSLDWTREAGIDNVYVFISTSLSVKAIGVTNIIADNLVTTSITSWSSTKPNNSICGSASNSYIVVRADAYTDATTFKAAMSGVMAVYELATPQTYQLTPQQVNTLVGTNNVWSEQGNIELSYHIPITNLLVKRQDVDDVSGGWLTLYSQPISQASDMDFTFIDFLNQYGKTYKYALVPLLTQTQSGVEVEVEGGYTVSDEVQSIFDGVFIADSTGSQKCKANVGYGNVDMNQVVGSITPIGAKYPIIITNSHNQYHNGSISGTIVPDDYYFNGNLSRIDMVKKRNELEQFLTNKRVKVIKDWNGNIWLVMIEGNVSCTFNNNYGMGIVDFSTNWIEVGDPTNQQDLQATGLINVGGV